jgi:hypothetical protein
VCFIDDFHGDVSQVRMVAAFIPKEHVEWICPKDNSGGLSGLRDCIMEDGGQIGLLCGCVLVGWLFAKSSVVNSIVVERQRLCVALEFFCSGQPIYFATFTGNGLLVVPDDPFWQFSWQH